MPDIHTLKETILHKEITHKLGRKEIGGTSRGKRAVGSTLPEGKGMGGAACHPRTAPSFTYVLAQDLSLISASWHTIHTVKPKSPSVVSLGIRDCLNLGRTHSFCVLTPVFLTLHILHPSSFTPGFPCHRLK